MGLSGPYTAIAVWFCGTWPFCLATWRMYHTGVMTLPEFNGPNEGLALLYCTHAFTALLGQRWCVPLAYSPCFRLTHSRRPPRRLWGAPVWAPVLGSVWPQHIYAGVGVVMFLIDGKHHVESVLASVRARGESRRSALKILTPMLGLTGLMLSWAALSPEQYVVAEQPYLFLLGCGFQFALLMGRIILGHLCEERRGMMAAMWLSLATLPLGVANAAAGAPLPEIYFLWLNSIYGIAVYVHFAMGVTDEITTLLGIKCFSLPKRAK